MSKERLNDKDPELNHLFWKDEILQVLYWMFGEELGDKVPLERLVILLNSPEDNLFQHLNQLLLDGYIEQHDEDGSKKFKLTDFGRKEAGQRFAGAFEGMQKVGHGECGPDCDCQWEGHDSCQHHLHKH
ncbi:MAG: hypothetical protein RJQ09_07915 [Cyclobacteriaceae bacterium]